MRLHLLPGESVKNMIFFFFTLDMMDISFVNKVENITKNPKVTAINSCIEVDVTGQVVSDSIGNRLYSGQFFFLNLFHSQ